MAISPPSDILLDVASAADPAQVRAATARLNALAADPGAQNVAFSQALARASGGPPVTTTTLSSGSTAPSSTSTAQLSAAPIGGVSHAAAASATGAHGKPSAYQKFEAVLLQSFVESMLPKDDETFGDKESAGVYRSMMAEQLANQLAAKGGIGIAKAIEHAHPAVPRTPADTNPA